MCSEDLFVVGSHSCSVTNKGIESYTSHIHICKQIATRRDLLDLKAELSEKVFNSTMRFDISQRHTKEMFERDLLSVRCVVRS